MSLLLKKFPSALDQNQNMISPKINLPQGAQLQQEKFHTQYIKCIGVVRGQWLKPSSKLKSICYGSGVAISKRIILTCAHCIYSQKKKIPCDSVSFIPNFIKGQPNTNNRVYKSANHQFLQFQQQKNNKSFSKGPIAEDIALIYLSQDLQLDEFPNVGTMYQQYQFGKETRLLISGFPSNTFYSQTDLQKISLQRQTLFGSLLEVQADILYHDLPTKTGHSGSGIFGINDIGQGTILGVHTHKGRRNMGVFLNKNLLKRLTLFEVKLGLFHQEYQMDIRFPFTLKKQAYEELSEDHKNILKTRTDYYESMNRQNNRISFIQSQQQHIEAEQSKAKHKQHLTSIYQLLEENCILQKDLFHSFSSKKGEEIFLRWLKLQNHFLSCFQKHVNYAILPQQALIQKISRQIFDFENSLSSLNKKVDQFQILQYKFPTVESHLNWNSILRQEGDPFDSYQLKEWFQNECFTNYQPQRSNDSFDDFLHQEQQQVFIDN